MEVHTKSHVKHEKKWKEYFFEFFMLFLAVSSGFFMENQREHFVEHHRAKQFAHSLYDDIKKDTAVLHQVMAFSIEKKIRLDSALEMLHHFGDQTDIESFYRNLMPIIRVNSFERSGATFEQIKSSGSLRYFDLKIVDLLNSYDVCAKRVSVREELESTVAINTMIPAFADKFNVEVAYDIFNNLPITHETYAKNMTDDQIDKVINLCVLSKRGRDRAMIEYTKLLEVANQTLDILKENYDVE